MIITLFLNISSYFFGFIAFLLPDWILPHYVTETWNGSISFLALVNGFFPVNAVMQVFILILMFEFFIIISRLIMGLVSLVRGGGNVDI